MISHRTMGLKGAASADRFRQFRILSLVHLKEKRKQVMRKEWWWWRKKETFCIPDDAADVFVLIQLFEYISNQKAYDARHKCGQRREKTAAFRGEWDLFHSRISPPGG